MQSFDQALMGLVKAETINYEDALSVSTHKGDFELRYKGIDPMMESGRSIPKNIPRLGDRIQLELTRETPRWKKVAISDKF